MKANHAPQITPAKESSVANIKELLKSSKSIAVVDYTGLKVSQATLLRQTIKKAGGHVLVTKNTLFQIAFGKPLNLSGLNAFIFSETDEVSAIKAVVDFAKKNSILTLKSGILGDRVLTAAEITQLANTPDKQTLAAKLVGTLNSPLFRLVYSLNWNRSKLVRTLEAIRVSKAI
jgi:large subunit ribosomal protein L10